MICPHCNETLPWWNAYRVGRQGSLRCVKCQQGFWLDLDDLNSRFGAWHLFFLFVFFFIFFAVIFAFQLPYPEYFPLLFLACIIIVSTYVTRETKTVAELSEGARRKQRYVRLGGLMLAIFGGGGLVNKDLDLYLIPFLVLGLIFFCIGFSPKKST